MKKRLIFVSSAIVILLVFAASFAFAAGIAERTKNINHIAINVKDMEKSIEFYGKIIGFEQGRSVRLEDLKLDITFFKLPGGNTLLELIHYDEANVIPPYDVTDRGILRHIAFTVDNVDAVAEELKKNGFEPHFGPIDLEPLGIRVVLVKDPNGVEVEFCQPIE
ncbi:MAG: lactoylglutathione lyase [Candidatus Atribacteria bacterium]|jgi:lactoylglutathione lyase|nr:lactoylglutathione lyase [Candidatus Atribacteria bacterium]